MFTINSDFLTQVEGGDSKGVDVAKNILRYILEQNKSESN